MTPAPGPQRLVSRGLSAFGGMGFQGKGGALPLAHTPRRKGSARPRFAIWKGATAIIHAREGAP